MHPLPKTLALVALLGVGCATGRIPNTEVPNTAINRTLITFCERYRNAVEAADTRTLLAMASPRYMEDGGTPRGDDDYGYEGLQRLLSVWADEVHSVRYEIRYHRIAPDLQHDGRMFIDYTYTASYTLRRPASVIAQEARPRDNDTPSLAIDPVRGATPVTEDDEIWYRKVSDNRLELERVGGEWRILSGM